MYDTHSHTLQEHSSVTTTPPCWIPHYHEQSHSRSVTSTLNSCSSTNHSPGPRERNASTNISHRAVLYVRACVRMRSTTQPRAQQSNLYATPDTTIHNNRTKTLLRSYSTFDTSMLAVRRDLTVFTLSYAHDSSLFTYFLNRTSGPNF